ncbi:MAG TPA: excinuclease ABC subunit UvrA [Pseudobacteroides sp.]|uniref:excinuclease ABC subunit UvrA n=1 Tax=Pseudobacteroides sp. TaxID=1968840 RepID=UPI002F932B2B
MHEFITIKGARENNLKNISLSIPKNKLVVLTGLSGSGKSTLAFDTLQKECQRQYMESMGMATDFISKPKVDSISGLSPSISIDQHLTNRNPRSTVGTVTDIYAFIRLLFAKLGKRQCPKCTKMIEPEFDQSDNDDMETWDGDFEGSGLVVNEDEGKSAGKPGDYGITATCPHCQEKIPELTASNFSFNKPEGACPSCSGLGVINSANISALIDEDRSIEDNAVLGWDIHYIKMYTATFEAAAKHYGFTFDTKIPVKELGKIQRDLLFYGVLSPQFCRHFPNIQPPDSVGKGKFEGVVTNVLRRYGERASDAGYREKMEKMLVQQVCHVCNGERLREESRRVIVNGRSITEVNKMSLSELSQWIGSLSEDILTEGLKIVKPIVDDISERIKRLIDVGVGYLTLERSAPTLSAGEAQRLRLAMLLGSGLTGVLYVLDEPTTGLHARDTGRLVNVLRQLRDMGNTVLVIEHDIEMMRAADYIIDIGPGAGKNGGQVMAAGKPDEVALCKESVTGLHLAGIEAVSIPHDRRKGTGRFISISGANCHNLKNVDAKIPLDTLVAITGVSGSGKSSMLLDILDPAVRQYLGKGDEVPGEHDRIVGMEHIDDIITIDQSPIGRTARSNAATYTDIFTPIRNVFAGLQAAKNSKLQAKHFSFNVAGGRCERCQGAGVLTVSMQFLPDVQVRCPVCHGRRFKREVLGVKYKGYDINDILNMTIAEASPLFDDVKAVSEKLSLMDDVGLGYLQLGQPANTLSGGEAQRIKLAKELGKKGKGHTLYLLDEPTTGLHPHDVLKLISLLVRLVNAGNSVVVIEHNVDVIAMANWIIDFGPEGGDAGGRIIAEGTPEQVALMEQSITGQQIRPILGI